MGDMSKESHGIFSFSPWRVKKRAHSYQHQLNPERDFSFPTHPYPFYVLCLKKYNLGNLDGFLCTTLLQVSNSRQYWSQCLKQPCADINSTSFARGVKEGTCFLVALSTGQKWALATEMNALSGLFPSLPCLSPEGCSKRTRAALQQHQPSPFTWARPLIFSPFL